MCTNWTRDQIERERDKDGKNSLLLLPIKFSKPSEDFDKANQPTNKQILVDDASLHWLNLGYKVKPC